MKKQLIAAAVAMTLGGQCLAEKEEGYHSYVVWADSQAVLTNAEINGRRDYSTLWPHLLQELTRYNFQNMSRGGRRLSRGDLTSWLKASNIIRDEVTDTIIYAVGANDSMYMDDIEKSRAELLKVVVETEARNLNLICVSPTDNHYMRQNQTHGYEVYQSMFEELCPVTFHAAEWIDPSIHMYDFGHFNKEGHLAYATGIYWALSKLK